MRTIRRWDPKHMGADGSHIRETEEDDRARCPVAVADPILYPVRELRDDHHRAERLVACSILATEEIAGVVQTGIGALVGLRTCRAHKEEAERAVADGRVLHLIGKRVDR